MASTSSWHDLLRAKNKLYMANVSNPLDRLRLYTYLISTLMTIVGIGLHFVGLLGVPRADLLTISTLWGCTEIALFALLYTGHIKITTAFILKVTVSQTFETARLIYLALLPTSSYHQFFVNELITFSILLLLALGLLYKVAFLFTVADLVLLAVCRSLAPQFVDSMTLCFFFLADIALCTYCYASMAFVKQITAENEEVKGKYNTFLSFMRMTETEVASLVQLLRSAFDDEAHINTLVSQLNDETKENLIKVARRIKSSQLAREEIIQKQFPTLSPTERQVCVLIVAGHSQKNIARITNKSENNVSTVRGNIRRKLNLDTTQDLRQHLMEVIG